MVDSKMMQNGGTESESTHSADGSGELAGERPSGRAVALFGAYDTTLPERSAADMRRSFVNGLKRLGLAVQIQR